MSTSNPDFLEPAMQADPDNCPVCGVALVVSDDLQAGPLVYCPEETSHYAVHREW